MRFVIIASPRTGSSHLVNVLSGHPEIFCNGNALHPGHMWLFWPESDLTPTVKAELRKLREDNPSAFLDARGVLGDREGGRSKSVTQAELS